MNGTEKNQSVGDLIRESMGDVISPELAEKINTMFQEAVDKQVAQKIQLTVENELDKQDATHAAELEKLLESVDSDHLEKTKKLLSAMDENYASKLVAYSKKMEKQINENAQQFQTALKESISNFLDSYIDKAIPMKTIEEAVQNTRSLRMIEQIKNVIGIDPAFVSRSVKSAVMEAKDHITDLENKVKELSESKSKLEEQLTETSQKLVLEQKTYGLPQEKRDFIMHRLGSRSVEEIEANYDYVCEMYDADQKEKRESARESAETSTKTVSQKIDKPREVVKESVEDKNLTDSTGADVSACLEILSNFG